MPKTKKHVDIEKARLLSAANIEELYQVGYTWIVKQVKENGFPRPIKVGPSYRWRKKDVEEWFDKKFDEE